MECLGVEYRAFNENIRILFDIFEKINEQIEHIAQTAENMDIFWDGEANSNYIARIAEDMVATQSVMVRVGKTIRDTKKALDIYLKTENEVQRMLNAVQLDHGGGKW